MKTSPGTILVAGGSSGLGAVLASRAAAAGYDVAILGRDRERLAAAAADVKALGRKGTFQSVDLRHESQTHAAVAAAFQEHPDISALVNCSATWTGGRSVLELTADDYREAMEQNFFVALHPVQALLREWGGRGISRGAIVNVGATASRRGGKNMSAIAVPKTALRTFSESLAREVGPRGIHVAHVVVDGLIDNPRTRGLNPTVANERFIAAEVLADSILRVVEEPPSCWTFEWDVRPYNEPW